MLKGKQFYVMPTEEEIKQYFFFGGIIRNFSHHNECDMENLMTKIDWEFWKDRYPKFNIYFCHEKDCKNFVLESGYCREHGYPGPIKFLDKFYFAISIGKKFIPYHQYLIHDVLNKERKPYYNIHHKDQNRWNNRIENLELIHCTEHRAIHKEISRNGKKEKHLQSLIEDIYFF